MIKKAATALFMATVLGGCADQSTSSLSVSDQSSPSNHNVMERPEAPKLCTAIRGNGQLIWAHFGGLSRVLETEGQLIDGLAGGSSASITSFLYESILQNPSISNQDISPEEQAERASLLLKSIYHWIDVFSDTPEGQALSNLSNIQAKLKGFEIRRLDSQDIAEVTAALGDLQLLLSSKDLVNLVDQEFIKFVFDTSLLEMSAPEARDLFQYRVTEIKNALAGLGAFSAEDPAILYRPGLVDFKQAAKYVGALGDFYADSFQLNRAEFDQFFAKCPNQGQWWTHQSSSCKSLMQGMMTKSLNKSRKNASLRLKDPIGRYTQAVISTAVLVHDHDAFEEGIQDYYMGDKHAPDLNKNSMEFGYAGRLQDLAKVQAELGQYDDVKSQKFMSLGAMTWERMLSLSPAEPGLTKVQPFSLDSKKLYSFGGWSDLAPIQVLKALGCEKTIYVTRQGGDSTFAQGVAALGGLSDHMSALFDFENPDSSFQQAVQMTDDILCSDWDNIQGDDGDPLSQIKNLITHTYEDAPWFGPDHQGGPIGCRR